MKNEIITIKYAEEKLSALKIYLEQKDTTVEEELAKFLDTLYAKTVPSGVRDYIEARAELNTHYKVKKKICSSSAVAVNASNEGEDA
jgi:hypothetical protein